MIDLHGYNIVGDGTPQALIPILTGVLQIIERQIQYVYIVWLLVLLSSKKYNIHNNLLK
jgi:hypothetical protein